MTTAVIIDAIVMAVLLIFVIRGARQGLIRALAGLVMVVVALVGAGMIAATFAGPAARLAAPVIQKQITERVEQAAAAHRPEAPNEEESGIEELLSLLGLVHKTFLRKYRRHAVVIIVIASAIITPTGDPFTLTVVAVPLYLLYELSILMIKDKKTDDEAEEVETEE